MHQNIAHILKRHLKKNMKRILQIDKPVFLSVAMQYKIQYLKVSVSCKPESITRATEVLRHRGDEAYFACITWYLPRL